MATLAEPLSSGKGGGKNLHIPRSGSHPLQRFDVSRPGATPPRRTGEGAFRIKGLSLLFILPKESIPAGGMRQRLSKGANPLPSYRIRFGRMRSLRFLSTGRCRFRRLLINPYNPITHSVRRMKYPARIG